MRPRLGGFLKGVKPLPLSQDFQPLDIPTLDRIQIRRQGADLAEACGLRRKPKVHQGGKKGTYAIPSGRECIFVRHASCTCGSVCAAEDYEMGRNRRLVITELQEVQDLILLIAFLYF